MIVAGPLCTRLDVHPEELSRVPRPGDLVAILDLGAYGFTESMPHFLSHPVAAEVAIRSGRVALIRRRIEPSEAPRSQVVPAAVSPGGAIGEEGVDPGVLMVADFTG